MARDLRVKVRLQADTKDAQRNIGKAEGSFRKFSTFLSQRFVVTLGDVSRAISGVFSAIQTSITLERQETALRGQLAAMGQDFDSFISTLQRVSNNTVATADLIASSSRALLLGIPAEEIDDLLQIAASRAAATGATVAEAFNDIAVGIGRASPLILDNLGFTIKLDDAYDLLAVKLGKTAAELTNAEKKTALMNAVIDEGKGSLDRFGESLNDAGTALEQTQAAMENFKNEGNNVISAIGTGLAAALTRATAGFVGFGFIVTLTIGKLLEVASKIPLIGQAFTDMADSAISASRSLELKFKDLIGLADSLSDSADEQAAKFLGLAGAQDVAAESAGNLATNLDKQKESLRLTAEESQALIDKNRTVAETTEAASAQVVTMNDGLESQIDVIRRLVEENSRLIAQGGVGGGVGGGVPASSGPAILPSFSSGSSSVRARDRRNQGFVDRALAAGMTPQNGRIRGENGGSRLVR